MIIGMDTAENKKYSCVVFGSNENIYNLYLQFEKEFTKVDWRPPFHWQKMALKSRKIIYENIIKQLPHSPVKFWIFDHRKPINVSKKEYYVRFIPNKISSKLEPFLSKSAGLIQIQADKDYEIKGLGGSTFIFLENLVTQLTFRLCGSPVRVFRTQNEVSAIIRTPKGLLNFRANAVSSFNSKAVQIADTVLGMYKLNPNETKEIVTFVKL